MSVKIRKFPLVPPADDGVLREHIQCFIEESMEREMTVDKVIDLMQSTDPNDCAFYEITEDNDCRGYLFAHAMPDEYGDSILLVQSAYVEPGTSNFWVEMVERLEEFGKSRGCKTMYFTTRRNPKAFMRLLRTKWTLDSHVMKHDFEKEPCGTSPLR